MPKTRTGGVFKLFFVFAVEIGFLATFHLLGNVQNMGIDFSNFQQWLDVTPPEVALIASVRILGLVFSYWLLATSLIYMVARALHMTKLLRGLELITLPGVRRSIDAGLAATIIGGTVFGGAGAVFANTQHNAQAQGVPAAVTTQYQDLRALYTPTPAGESAPMSATPAAQDSVQTPTQEVSSQVGVQSSTNSKVAMPEEQATQTQSVQTPTASVTSTDPVKDADGNYIPQPAETTTTTTSPESTSTTSPDTTGTKVVVTTPQPADTTTTLPKVAVPIDSAPVTTPAVDIAGKQVQQPNDTTTTTPTQTSTSYTVVPGDNFWAIAKAHVQSNTGHEPNNAEVANYWVKLIEANKATIRSGDPDLIFPGEVFTLPPL